MDGWMDRSSPISLTLSDSVMGVVSRWYSVWEISFTFFLLFPQYKPAFDYVIPTKARWEKLDTGPAQIAPYRPERERGRERDLGVCSPSVQRCDESKRKSHMFWNLL